MKKGEGFIFIDDMFDCSINFSINNLIDEIFSKRKVKKILKKYNVTKYYISHFFTNIEHSIENGSTSYKNARLIEMNDISFETLINIAKDVCKEFKQEKVLVKDNKTNKIMYINSK